MDDWKERLKAEYAQTKERYENLKAWNNKQDVQRNLYGATCKVEDDYNRKLCHEQQHIMGEYLHVMELRAELFSIELKP